MAKLGKKSMKELVGVHPLLSACAWMAVENMEIEDATIFDGLRTLSEQRTYVKLGRSKTMNSKHLSGRAVDIVPYIDGRPMWDSTHPFTQNRIDDAYEEINKQMKKYARVLGIQIESLYDRAGWDKPHFTLISVNGKPCTYDYRDLI